MRHGLVVEDQAELLPWLSEALVQTFPGIEVTTAASLAAARAAISSRAPDIALIDLGLPDGSGIELIRSLSALHPACQCIVSTIYADDHHLFPALRAGASGYLLKDQPREKVIQALSGIGSGEPPLSASVARRLLRVFGEDGKDAQGPALTPRERQTLALIAKGFKIVEVAQQLGVSRNTAAEYIQAVYRKLNVSNRAEAAIEAARMGLVNTRL